MVPIGVFAEAPEVLRSVNWDVVKVLACTFGDVALDFSVLGIEVVVFLVAMIAEALGGGTDGLAVFPLIVSPIDVKPVLDVLPHVFELLVVLVGKLAELFPSVVDVVAVGVDVFLRLLVEDKFFHY